MIAGHPALPPPLPHSRRISGLAAAAFLALACSPGVLAGLEPGAADSVERERVLRQLHPGAGFLGAIRAPAMDSVFGQCVTWNGVSYALSADLTMQQAESFVDSLPPLGRRRYEWSGQVWESTATNGPVSVPGERITLTWSFVPDGTMLYTIELDDAPMVPSNLFSTMNQGFGNQQFWMNIFRESFDDWGELLGVDYVEVSDDGAPQGAPGELGARGDIRIGMQPIDTLGGILAFNFYPLPDDYEGRVPPGVGGDMTLDSQDIQLWSTDLGDNFLALRNTIRHEHGHGLGYDHVDPLNQTKLMEALMTTAFDGPQEDDIRGTQRIYGDWLETNSTIGEATPVGLLPNLGAAAPVEFRNVALERHDSIDLFGFEVPDLALLKFNVRPVGTRYLSGPFQEIVTQVDALRINDLVVDLLAADGTTVLATIDDAPIGVAEGGSFPMTNGAGEYFLRVRSGTDNDDVQRYELDLGYVAGSPDAAWEAQPARVDDSAGNNNGRFDPGESGVVLRVPIRNIGFSAGSGLVGTLESLTPTVSVVSGEVHYGDAEPGETLVPTNGFVVNVHADHVCGDPVVLHFAAGSSSHQFEDVLSIGTGAPGPGVPVEYRPLGPVTFPAGGFNASRIAVADEMTIARVRLTGIDLTYPNLQDLVIFLQSPRGTVIYLSFNSFRGANLRGTTLSDDAVLTISQGTAPYTGEFMPDGQLSQLIGEQALGFWDFGVFNLLGNQSGTIDGWTLEITPVAGIVCEDVPIVSDVDFLSLY